MYYCTWTAHKFRNSLRINILINCDNKYSCKYLVGGMKFLRSVDFYKCGPMATAGSTGDGPYLGGGGGGGAP